MGALVGGCIERGLGWYSEGDQVGLIMALIGAI
ncbi:MAG: GlsB/YeaQ/YmgE family stress response membrane protein [Nitrospirales bacterium]